MYIHVLFYIYTKLLKKKQNSDYIWLHTNNSGYIWLYDEHWQARTVPVRHCPCQHAGRRFTASRVTLSFSTPSCSAMTLATWAFRAIFLGWYCIYISLILEYIYIIYSILVIQLYLYWLVVEPYPSEKWWSSSLGMTTFPVYGKIKAMFQTTNQYIYIHIERERAREWFYEYIWLADSHNIIVILPNLFSHWSWYIYIYDYILLFLSLDAPIWLRRLRTLTSLLNGPEGSTEGSTAILVLL